jgi:hydroxymethylbilane synthase
VQTRLSKLKSGVVHATILAMAGLNRLNLAHEASSVLETEMFLPAVAQGAIALVVRSNDRKMMAVAKTIIHAQTTACVAAERAFLTVLDGSCKTPIAAFATMENGAIHLRGMVLSPDGVHVFADEDTGQNAVLLGEVLGQRIKARLPADIFLH